MVHGTPESRGLTRPKPDGRVWLLHRLGFHSHVLKLPEGAGHLRRGLCPQRFHDLDALHEAAHALPAGQPKDRLGHMSTNANAHGQTSLAELVQAREDFCELHRIAQHGQHDRCAQAQARRERCGVGEQANGLQHRHTHDDRFLHPQAVITQRFRLLDKVLDEFYIDGGVAKHLRNGNATRRVACCHGSGLPDEVYGHRVFQWHPSYKNRCCKARYARYACTDDTETLAGYYCGTLEEQVSRTGRYAVSLAIDATVQVGVETEVVHSLLRHTTVGRGCRIVNSVLEGHPEWPVTIGDHVTLINCHVRSTGERNAFDFCGWEVDQRYTRLEDGVAFSNSRLWNAAVGTE